MTWDVSGCVDKWEGREGNKWTETRLMKYDLIPQFQNFLCVGNAYLAGDHSA